MKRLFIVFIILNALKINSYSQGTTFTNGLSNGAIVMGGIQSDLSNGKYMYTDRNYTIEGNPFFPEEYNLAKITTTSGKIFDNVLTKFNFTANVIICKVDTNEFVVATPVTTVEFLPSSQLAQGAIFINGFPKVDAQTEKDFYEVLENGKAKLLKLHKTSVRDDVPYGSAGVTKIFETKETLYAFVNNQIIKVVPNNNFIIDLLKDSQNRIKKFIVDNKLKCRKEDALIKLFHYYNSIEN